MFLCMILYLLSGKSCKATVKANAQKIHVHQYTSFSHNLKLRGGADAVSSEKISDTLEINREDGGIRFSDETEPSDHSNNTSTIDNGAKSVGGLYGLNAAHADEDLQIAVSASHRFSDVKEPAFEDPLDDPSLCPAVQFFLTRCPAGRADRGMYLGSVRWHLVALHQCAWEGQASLSARNDGPPPPPPRPFL